MAYVRVTITDTMGFWDEDFGDYIPNPHHSKTFTVWYRVPEDWVTDDGWLRPERHGAIYDSLYGPTWRNGNGDGSKFVLLKATEHVLTPPEAAARPWRDTREGCYRVDEAGVIGAAEREDF